MYFIDLRATSGGGIAAEEASVYWEDGSLRSPEDFARDVQAKDVVLAAHGFNVNREHGRNSLTCWSERCNLPSGYMLVGILWPGDSAFFPILDYPVEGLEAIISGKVLAKFLNQYATGAQSLSLVSHSLGARMVLQALDGLDRSARRLILMAGAIEDDCLVNEYAGAAGKAQQIYVIASKEDRVLKFAFPIGNPVGEIIMHDHPYFRAAIGRAGPASFDARTRLWQIPDGWDYGHLDYLPSDRTGPQLPPPLTRPGDSAPAPTPSTQGWKPSWSAGAVSTQVV
jgi:pimeloyl-ACP methyl ester carboxylesterase